MTRERLLSQQPPTGKHRGAYTITRDLESFFRRLRRDRSGSVAVVALITVFAIAIAPVFEEFLFRGFAYPVLKQRWGASKALVVVSAAFAAIHLHLPSLGPLFALAVGLGLAYELTGSLLAPITMHVLFNAANVLMILYVRAHS